MYQYDIEKLSKRRISSLVRLSHLQNHIIQENHLYYKAQSYLSLKQLFHFQISRCFSLGQLTIIFFNTIDHLLKIHQTTSVSKLTEDNIFINKELKIMFINLHIETDDQLTYEQNRNHIINIFSKLLNQYSESLQQQMNDHNQSRMCQKIQIANIYLNKILKLLLSDNHHKQLRQFIQEQIQDQRIKDKHLDDQVINKHQFDQIFQQQQNLNKVQSEVSQGGQSIYNQSNESELKKASIITDLYPTQQLKQYNSKNFQESQPISDKSSALNNQYQKVGSVLSYGVMDKVENREVDSGINGFKEIILE